MPQLLSRQILEQPDRSRRGILVRGDGIEAFRGHVWPRRSELNCVRLWLCWCRWPVPVIKIYSA